MRRTLRASMKAGGAVIDLKYLGPREKEPPIVALLDISGSMSQYTRLFLHFLHAVTDARKRVQTFLFGTRLTNVTRALRQRDPGRGAGRLFGQCRRLVGRHADRDLAARVQQAMGAPRADAGRGGAADHRRARARPRRPARLRDRPAAPLLPAADLAQSAAALRRLRGPGQGHPHHAAACRRIAADPQSGVDDRAGARAVGRAGQGLRSESSCCGRLPDGEPSCSRATKTF